MNDAIPRSRCREHAAEVRENALLSSILRWRNDALASARRILGDDSSAFELPENACLYEAMLSINDAGLVIDVPVLVELLSENKPHINAAALIESVGSGDVPTSENVARYAESIRDAHVKHQLQKSFDAASRACRNGRSANAILETLRNETSDLDLGDRTSSVLPRPAILLEFDQPASPREFVFEGVFARGTVTMLAASGGKSKSWLAWMLAVSTATGRKLLSSFDPERPKRALVLSAEDDANEFHRRFQSIVQTFKLSKSDIAGFKRNLLLYAGTGFPLVELSNEKKVPTPTRAFEDLQRVIAEFSPDLITVDPAALFHAVDENSNPHMAFFISALAALAREARSRPALILLHHTNKSDGDNATRNAARGASALHDGVREMFQLTQPSSSELRELGLDDPTACVKLTAIKANYTPLRKQPIFFMRKDGGCLDELDVIRDQEDARVDRLNRGGEIIADVLGGGKRVTGRELMKPSDATDTANAKRIRKLVDQKLGAAGLEYSRPAIERYLEHGKGAGHLREIQISTGSRTRRELVANGPTDQSGQ